MAESAPAFINNDPLAHEGRGYSPDVVGLHRGLEEDPDGQGRQYLTDAHRDMGDDVGADFWNWWTREDRSADAYEGFHYFDNRLVPEDKSRFSMPLSIIELMHHQRVRYPLIVEGGRARPIAGQPITTMGFDGRLLAETTILAGWRLLTDNERAALVDGNYDYIDPSREWADQ